MKRLLIIFLVLVLLAAAATLAGILLSDRPGPGLGGPTVLVWHVQGPIPERTQPDLFTFTSGLHAPSVSSLYRGFRRGLEAPEVKGLALYIRGTGFGFAKAAEFRRQLRAFADAGKFVECYFETVGEASNGSLGYLLAAACDRIHLAPVGAVNLLGLYSDPLFLREGLDKLKVEPEFFTAGEYKSAGEQYERTEHSPESREAISAALDGWFDLLVDGIAAGRGFEPDHVRSLIDRAPYTAQEALDAELVDSLSYPDEFRARIEKLAGGAPRLVPLETFGRPSGFAGTKVAVVFTVGTIIRGVGGVDPWSEQAFSGSDDLGETLRDLRDDASVSAVILRIDSPGGSALASDLVLRQVDLLRERKPVIVSMSDLAASGGYYIGAKADKIVAEAGTLTGSIGVITGRFATEALERELLGIRRDPIARGARAGLWRDPAPMDEDRTRALEKLMSPIYRTFLAHVAEGRDMSVEEVDLIARGRIWLGRDAQRLGLVDEIGGFDRAVELAREAAGIEPERAIRLVYYPETRSWLQLLESSRRPRLPASLRGLARLLEPRAPAALELPPELADLPGSL